MTKLSIIYIICWLCTTLQIYAQVKDGTTKDVMRSDVINITGFKAKDKKPPVITLLTPKLNYTGEVLRENKENLHILLSVTDNETVEEVTVNSYVAKSTTKDVYEVTIPLKVGSNLICVIAKDKLLNQSQFDFSVIREVPQLTIASTDTEDLNIDIDISATQNNTKYHALLIAVEDYQNSSINKLDKPVKDADSLRKVLCSYYNFEESNVTFLKNPTREQIVITFDELSKKLTNKDNLLIFYAGHGIWDEKMKKGYWLPADAQKDSRAGWFSNSDLRDYIGGIGTKHTLLIADACFSGGIFKTRDAFENASPSMKELYKMSSRKAMTSGALKTVPDESVFIKYLLRRLTDNQQAFLTAIDLFGSLKTAVMNNSPNGQVPMFGEIKETGDEGGDFIFIKKRK